MQQQGAPTRQAPLRAGLRSRGEGRRDKDVELTKGDFFEMVLAAFEAAEAGTDLADAAKALARSPQPSAHDRRDDRTEFLEVFATPDLARALKTDPRKRDGR